MQFHIVGIGAIGSLIAAHLRRMTQQSTKITLLTRRPHYSVTSGMYGENTALTIHRFGAQSSVRGFNWEIAPIDEGEGLGSSGEDDLLHGASGGNGGFYGGGTGGGLNKSDMLRDLVFNNDGSVRKALGFKGGYARPPYGWKEDGTPDENASPTPNYIRFKQPVNELAAESSNNSSPISSLIVTTKSHGILPALRSIRHRLSAKSTIVLLNNGMGIHEQLVSELFKNAADRPHFVLGTLTHGAWKKSNFEVVHTTTPGMGNIRLGIVPDWRGRDFERTFWTETPRRGHKPSLNLNDIVTPAPEEDGASETFNQDYTSLHETMKALLSLNDLDPRWEPISDIQTALRQKLVANCVINPLTALLNVRNGELFAIPGLKLFSRILCQEAMELFEREAQEQGGNDKVKFRVAPTLEAKRLNQYVIEVARVTASNYSSMLVDVRKGSVTEIVHMNDHLSNLGKQLGVPTPYNDTLSMLVKAKHHTVTAFKPRKN